MKILDIRERLVSIPLDEPLMAHVGGKFQWFTHIPHVFCDVTTDDGITGTGYICSLSTTGMRALITMIDEMKPFLIGQDPELSEEIFSKVRDSTAVLHWAGLVHFAMCAIDCALWDIKGKAKGVPVYRLIGGLRNRIPAYASGRLFRSRPFEELAPAAIRVVQMGFRMIKMNAGAHNIPEEIRRVKAVREAIGDSVELLVDLNEGANPAQAIRLGKAFEEFNIFWLEDPVPAENIMGSAEVAAALDVPVAAGELHSEKSDFRDLIVKRALDIMMIDVQRVGGISEWIKIAEMAEIFNVPVSTHILTEVSCHLGSQLNCVVVEMMPWTEKVFTSPLKLEDGMLVIPEKPGLGIELDEEAMGRYAVI